jgi:hypothetical protein
MGQVEREVPMQDLGLVLAVIVFFALSLAFVRLCARLR